MAQTPSLGRVVLVLVNPITNNGSDIAPAMVTRVWEQGKDGSWGVNLKANLDSPTTSKWFTSVRLFDTEDEARAHDGEAAYWPPRTP
ncbi:hypothetical protein ABZ609_00495 [Streptomyces rubiginosohelvolus]|uniref:hypothetical protein n=1 Tax=Streptomyces rubiginosohelvolus TaxID=67362 RepID=UPI0033C0AF9D